MTHQIRLNNLLVLLFLMLSFCSTTILAQSETEKTMTITIIAVDEDGNQTTQTIVREGDEVDENNIEAEIDALIAEMQQDNQQLEINVNVEVEGPDAGGDEMVEEKTITIDMSGDDSQMIMIDTDEELDDATRMKLEKALEGSDIDLDDLLNGKVGAEKGKRKMRVMKMRPDPRQNKAFLGVIYIKDNDQETLSISKVVEGSAAEKAGLKEGDVFVTIDSKTVGSHDALVDIISVYEPGDVVNIVYTRDGEQMTTKATLTGNEKRTGNVWFQENQKQGACSGMSKANCNPGCCADGNKPVGCCEDKAKKARLGVYLENGDFGGAKISEVMGGSNAETIGIKAGDIITKVGKTKIQNEDELIDAINEYKVGDEVKIQFKSDGKKNKEKLTFAEQKMRKRGRRGCCSGAKKGCSKGKLSDNKKDTEIKIQEKVIIRKKKSDNNEVIVEENIIDNPANSLKINTIDIFPNPTNGLINIKFTIPNKKATTIKLTDVGGKVIFSEINPDFLGSYSTEIDLRGNPEGIYLLSIEQDDKVYTEKIVYNKER